VVAAFLRLVHLVLQVKMVNPETTDSPVDPDSQDPMLSLSPSLHPRPKLARPANNHKTASLDPQDHLDHPDKPVDLDSQDPAVVLESMVQSATILTTTVRP